MNVSIKDIMSGLKKFLPERRDFFMELLLKGDL